MQIEPTQIQHHIISQAPVATTVGGTVWIWMNHNAPALSLVLTAIGFLITQALNVWLKTRNNKRK